MRLGNDAQVIKNINKLLKEKKLKQQVVSDANALLAESFLNLEQKDSAIVKLKIAENYSKNNTNRARYRFILGQLYQELGIKDTALLYYQKVIDMNRKAERKYVIQAYAKKAQLFDFDNDDENQFVETYNKLIQDRENRPFKDVIYHEMGVFYDKKDNQIQAKGLYNNSLKTNSADKYLIASNYRNIGNMYFKNTDYSVAAKYYDSTLVSLEPKTREHIRITKVRKDLDEVIGLELIAKTNDSILKIVAMSDTERVAYFEDYIGKLKKSDEEKRLLAEKQKEIQKNIDRNNLSSTDDATPGSVDQPGARPPQQKSPAPPTTAGISSTNTSNIFYFYNPSIVSYGKIEFKKKFGNRTLEGNWRVATKIDTSNDAEANKELVEEEKEIATQETPQYNTAFYIGMLPNSQAEIDRVAKDRNFAYYQLGIIYKEKFKEYALASDKLEKLLKQNPEQKLVLPSLYNLYKIYQITDNAKAQEIKNSISSQYPDSRYAQIINNKNPSTTTESEAAEAEYAKWYKLYQEEQFFLVLESINGLIIQYYGEEIVPKYELLKATIIGKLRGLDEYKKALQFVADNYPSKEEGKNAKEVLTSQIPVLEGKNFTSTDTKKWLLLYKVGKLEDKKTKELEEIIKKFIKTENAKNLSFTFDIHTEKENFIAVEGMKSEVYAKNIAAILKEDKKYKVTENGIVISNENYEVIQVKKNLEAYINSQKNAAVPAPTNTSKAVVPIPAIGNNSTNDETPKQAVPAASEANRTKATDTSSKTESNNVPKISSTPK